MKTTLEKSTERRAGRRVRLWTDAEISLMRRLADTDCQVHCALGDSSAPWPVYSTKPETALVELINGAYDIIEIWKAESPAQISWKKAWMAKARELGARPAW